MSAARERLAALCDQITRHVGMEEAVRQAGAGAHLDELLDSVRAADAPDPIRLTTLLDAIEDACDRDGLTGITTTVRKYTQLPDGFRRAAPVKAPTWVCPLRRCARTVIDDETTPQCAAGNAPMTPFQLL